MSTFIDICPGANPASPSDRTAKRLAWIGTDPDNSSLHGAYFKGPVWIGGTSTADAAITANGSGTVVITIKNPGTASIASLTPGYLSVTDFSLGSSISGNYAKDNFSVTNSAGWSNITGTVSSSAAAFSVSFGASKFIQLDATSGNIFIGGGGGLYVNGLKIVGPRQSRPTTLTDVINLLIAHGLCS